MSLAYLTYLVLFLPACSSTLVSHDTDAPGWTRQTDRVVDGGYVVYVGSGEDVSLERAHFKAESMALQSLVNECSFAPKGTRTEATFDQKEGSRFRSWARVAVEAPDCEKARAANTPDEIRKLANSQITQELKRYADMIGETPPPEMSASEGPKSGSDDADANAVNSAYVSTRDPIQDYPGYWFARERLVFIKQNVILAPPTKYLPGTPETQALTANTATAVRQTAAFESSHPQARVEAPRAVREQRVARIQSSASQAIGSAGPHAFTPHTSNNNGHGGLRAQAGPHVRSFGGPSAQPKRRRFRHGR
jgi:hypothetical protein